LLTLYTIIQVKSYIYSALKYVLMFGKSVHI
jgi:hypothetical protein